MYIINDTYFQTPKREVPNLDEADSKSFVELERLIDEKCRLFMYYFLTQDEITEFNSYLVDDIFPSDTTGIPQKWIDLVNGANYTSNGVDLVWNGLIQERGTSKSSLLADYVYYHFLMNNASYITGMGDAKGNPKGAFLVNPTQRIVTVWNEFVGQYQSSKLGYVHYNGYFPNYDCYLSSQQPNISLLQFLSDHSEDYTSENHKFFEVRNQLGI